MHLQLDHLFTIVLIFVSVLMSKADGYFWSLWGAPITDQQQQEGLLDADGSVLAEDPYGSHPRNIQSRFTPPSGMLNDDPDTSAAFQELMPKPPCRTDKACGRGRYCDVHYGDCRYHKLDGEPCRRDGHCQKSHECRFGTCQAQVKPGTEGARCKNDRDCSMNMCCAKQHGESVCKAKLPIGAKCYVPEGGVEYVIDSICPCKEGLVCKSTDNVRQDRQEETVAWRFWTDFDHMRCQPTRFPPNRRR